MNVMTHISNSGMPCPFIQVKDNTYILVGTCVSTCAEALGYKSFKLLLLLADWHYPSFWPECLRSNDVVNSNLSLSKQITFTNFLRSCHVAVIG